MTLLYNMYKPINFHSGLFSELRYMSSGLTFKIFFFLTEIDENYAIFTWFLPVLDLKLVDHF